MREIKPEQWDRNVFDAIGSQWMLVTAGKEKVNTMTASWGGMGVLWGKNVVYVFLRPQRYTKEFVDREERFSLSFLPEQFREQLKYFGTVSGREEDKIAACGLAVQRIGDTPYFADAEAVMICKKLYVGEIRPEEFLGEKEAQTWYPGKDYHSVYVAEIESLLVK